jgi:CspA family cold shock protein
MPTGRIKWFNTPKGYGFILPDDGSPDVFLSIRSLGRATFPSLTPGIALQYSISGKGGRAFAERVSVIEPANEIVAIESHSDY